jgi:euchromatic histone-lysine N-methyltransferase
LWLYRDKLIVGPIPGVYGGDVFLFRMELCVVGLHMQIQVGIDYLPKSRCSNGESIATTVIVSGGYELVFLLLIWFTSVFLLYVFWLWLVV